MAVEYPLCAECEKNGKIVPGEVTDHIIPISQGSDTWDKDNLQRLCINCHNTKSRKERKKR